MQEVGAYARAQGARKHVDAEHGLPKNLAGRIDLLIGVEEGCSRVAFERYAARAGLGDAVTGLLLRN